MRLPSSEETRHRGSSVVVFACPNSPLPVQNSNTNVILGNRENFVQVRQSIFMNNYYFSIMFNKAATFIALSFICTIFMSCNTTHPTDVPKSDTQKITSIQYGKIVSSMPVSIKGEGGPVGAITGGVIGGLLGTQVCGERRNWRDRCEDIATVSGAIGGATLGYVTEAFLGNHDGFQYIIDIDKESEDVAIVQGNKTPLRNGERVVVIYGDVIRVLPYADGQSISE